MHRTTGYCESEQQAAGSILIIGIVLNDSGLYSGLSDFGIADISLNGALKAWRLMFSSKMVAGTFSSSVASVWMAWIMLRPVRKNDVAR